MTRHRPLAARAILAAALTASAANPASAQTTGIPTDRIEIGLRGTIPPRCEVYGLASDLDLGRLAQAAAQGERELGFIIDCNTPFGFSLASLGGALRHETATSAGPGLTAQLPYRAVLSVATDEGATLRMVCEGPELSQGCEAESGGNIAAGQPGSLRVSWGSPTARLIEGRYRDELRIGLNARH